MKQKHILKQRGKKKITHGIFLYVLAALCGLGACARLENCYIENTDAADAGRYIPNNEVQVNYFFDRTDSMRGFTRQGMETDYDKALDSLLTVGQTQGYGNQSFYEFGEQATVRLPFSKDVLLSEIKVPDFYGENYDPFRGGRQKVEDNGGQPFSSVARYIKQLDEDGSHLNFVVTDLYEQRGRYEYFHLLFQNTFSSGDSGAIFAVKSTFRGNIHSISAVDSNKNIRVDGYSTFFIFIVGDKQHVKQYSAALSDDLAKKRLIFNISLFFLDEPDGATLEQQPDTVTAGNKKRFDAAANNYNTINLRRNNSFIRTWEKRSGEPDSNRAGFAAKAAKAEAYLVMTNIGAQYMYRTTEQTGYNPALPLIENLSLAYFSGTTKTHGGDLSNFDAVPHEKLLTPSVFATDGYNYFKIGIDSKNLAKGYYRITFNIIPDWVEALDAVDISSLEASNKPGDTIKILNLGLIYRNILKEFNRENNFSKAVYLIKNK
jgi:hypothetical protein